MPASRVTTRDPVVVSRDSLEAVRREDATDGVVTEIRDLKLSTLSALSDPGGRAFWINLYNAAGQDRLRRDPERFDRRWRFYRRAAFPVAGKQLSLDDIEHGLLRLSRLKWGLGSLSNPFPGDFERQLRVTSLDPRIHFALNCGAASCPPIGVYTVDDLDEQLHAATAAYLEQSVTYEPARGIVRLPRLFLWYRGDFGGKTGILDLLVAHGHLPRDVRPRLTHRSYDWSLSLGDFTDLRH